MDTSTVNPALFLALSEAQGEIENASKKSENPHFRSKYADLAEILNTVRPVFSKHGLSMIQSTEFDGSMVSVVTVIAHKEGGYLSSKASCVPAKTDAQGVGSATTYLRRYGAAAAAGIAQEDDDGQSAAHNGKPNPVSATGKASPSDGVWDGLDAQTQRDLKEAAADIEDSGPEFAYKSVDYIDSLNLPTEHKAALWTLLSSKVRSAIKKEYELRKNK